MILTSSPSHSVPDENHVRYRTIFMEPSQTKNGGLFDVLTQEMRLRNYSLKTIKSYKSCLRSYIKYFTPKHPRELSKEDIRRYLLYLIEHEHAAASTVNQVFNALRFLYVELYNKSFTIDGIPRPRKEKKLPVVLSQGEVLQILSKVENLKHRTLLMLIYSAGLRVGESVRLKVSDIDSSRKMIHVRNAKGMKDRYTLLSETALDTLRNYYKLYKPQEFLFAGAEGRSHLSERSIQHVFERAREAAGIYCVISDPLRQLLIYCNRLFNTSYGVLPLNAPCGRS